MHLENLKRISSDQAGFALVEIVVSALLLVIVSVGVFTAFDSGTRATAQERHRARANEIADADLARMRSMRIANLSSLNQTRTLTYDAIVYTIVSRADFVTENATTSTCSAGVGSRDYLKISTSVTWLGIGSRPPVTAASIVSPPSGSVVPNSGSLLVSVDDSRSNPMSGVTLTGGGAGSFSGTTGANGCVLWRNLPAGNYTMNASGAASGKVDPDGNPPAPQTVSVVAQSTNTVTLQYDSPGRIQNINFRTRDYADTLVTSTADAVVVDQTGMQSAKVFGTGGGTRASSFTTTMTLFPYISTYTLYAGSCGSNNPGTGGALASSTVPVGGTGNLAAPGYIQLPALHVTLWSGTDAGTPGTRVSGGDVTVFDDNCNVQRTLTTNTNSQGQVPVGGDIGLPYSTDYHICGNNSAKTDRRVISNFPLTAVGTAGTDLNIYLQGTTGAECP